MTIEVPMDISYKINELQLECATRRNQSLS